MKSFLAFLQKQSPALHKRLLAAGGDSAARKGSKEFINTWKQVAKEHPNGFAKLQYEFIKTTHYQPQVDALRRQTGIDVNKRSVALQEAVWSIAVQHGPDTQKIFKNALAGRDVAQLSDKELIQLVYAERSKYFSRSTPQERAEVKKRLAIEEKEVLRMLGGR